MISVKVDQFTLTILPGQDDLHSFGTSNVLQIDYAEHIRSQFEKLTQIRRVFSRAEQLDHGVRNYDTVYCYGYQKAQIFFKYNSNSMANGISIEFKAQALKQYLKAYRIKNKRDINVHHVLKWLASEFIIRLSRVDIAIDFYDEDLKVSYLDYLIKGDNILIKNKGNRIVPHKKINTIGNNGFTQTIYVNNRKGDSYLRIYDKKEEALSTNGVDYFEALKVEDWTRFELELKGTYAHNTTKALIECEDDNDKYLSLLSGIFIQFFKFYTVKTYDDKGKPILENADFYQKMIDIYNAEGPMIDGHKSNNATEFDVKYQNLFKNGTMTFLKMVYIAYGDKGFDEFIDHVKDDLKGKVKLNKDHLTMIKNNKSDDLFFR